MNIINLVSIYVMPVMVVGIVIIGIYKGIDAYECFVDGAREGMETILKITPMLVGLMLSISVFRASGALELLINLVRPITYLFKIPEEVLPLVILKPISGSASLAVLYDIYKNYGVDTFIGNVASTLVGSTETIFYTLTVYFGAVGIKKTRYTLCAALIADIITVIVAMNIWRIMK